MPALDWRIIPARSIRRCETICASLGFSRSNGRKYSERRIEPHPWVGRRTLGKTREPVHRAAGGASVQSCRRRADAGSQGPLTLWPGPDDDEPVSIPLSTAEKCVFASRNCPVRVENLLEINQLNPIWPSRATAEIAYILGCRSGVGSGSAAELAWRFRPCCIGI